MARTIDLSITVRDGDGRLGLAVEFSTPYAFENVGWQGSTVSMFCHYATHVDAPNHFIRGGSGIDVAPLERLMGPAGVVELRDHGEDRDRPHTGRGHRRQVGRAGTPRIELEMSRIRACPQ